MLGGVAGGEEELVGLLFSETEELGAAEDVVAVAGAGGDAFLPADEGEAADRDAAGQLGVADAGASHVSCQ